MNVRMALVFVAMTVFGLAGCSTLKEGYQAGSDGVVRGFEKDKKAAEEAVLMSKCRVGYGAGLSLEKCTDIYALMEDEKEGWKCEGLSNRVSCTRPSRVVAATPSKKMGGKNVPPLIDLREFYRVMDK